MAPGLSISILIISRRSFTYILVTCTKIPTRDKPSRIAQMLVLGGRRACDTSLTVILIT